MADMDSKYYSRTSEMTMKNQTAPRAGRVNVAHIASGDLWAGAEVQLFNLAVQLQQLPNIKLYICLLNYGQLYEKLTSAGISVSVIDESKLSALNICIKLYHALQQFRPNVVHTHRLKENILGSVVTLLLGSTRSIRTVHGAPEHHHGFLKPHKRLQNYLDYLCGRYLQRNIIAVSEDLADQLSATFPARNITTILNGVDCQTIESLATKPADSNYLKGSEVKICFAGRLAPVKRLDLWLETASILVDKSDRQFSFYIIGDGPEKDRLKVLASELGISKHLHFLGEKKNVPSILKQMDILLITSDHEGLPMIILEALCLKTLVVAHAVGGISAVLDDGRAGYLVARHDSNCYAENVLRSLDESNEANKKKEVGYARVNSIYAARECSKKYVSKYLELL